MWSAFLKARIFKSSMLTIIVIAALMCLGEVAADTSIPINVRGHPVRHSGRASTRVLTSDSLPTQPYIVSNAQPTEASSHGHKMSLTTLIINIVADLCPHGMLPLAYGIAQGGPTGIVPAVALVAIFGSMSAYTMTVFARIAEETKSSSIAELWGKLIGQKTRWLADVAVFSLCFGCCVFYSAFVGDIFGALSAAAGVTGVVGKRSTVLGAISALCLLPLCLLEDISSLQFSSILGVAGIMFTVVFHILRVSDGTYTPETGLFAKLLSRKMQPKWPSPKFTLWSVNKGTLMLVNMLCVAFLAHYNAINYYKELDGATEKRYKTAITAGFGTALTVFIGMMFLGYTIFGSTAQPLVLNNFHRTEDVLATAARFATGLAITFAYPLMFAGLKSSMYSLIDSASTPKPPAVLERVKGKAVVKLAPPENKLLKSSCIVAVLSVITSIAIQCGEEDVSLVLGIVGSVLGCGVAYVLPGILSLKHMRVRKAFGLKNASSDVILAHVLVAMGSFFGALGVWVTLQTPAHH